MLFRAIIGTICGLTVVYQPFNKQVESAWYFGFEQSVSTPSVGVGNLRTPEVTVTFFHIPAGQTVVESGQQAVAEVATTVAQSAGLDVDFTLGNRTEAEMAIIHGAFNLGITDVGQISYILATAKHESDQFKTTKEYGGCDYFANIAGGGGYSNILGNQGREDACTYFGRGLVQLTGRNNYKRMSDKYGVDFLTNPELVEEPGYAITIMIEGMMGGWFTGVGLPRYVNESKRDYVNARRVVNGTDRAAHIASLARNYEPMVERALVDYGFK